MDTARMLLERHTILHDYFLDSYERTPSPEQLRARPHARTNSIAWNLWHVARAEDFGINCFVADRAQVLDTGWMQRMNLPLRHGGSGMTFDEVDALSAAVDLNGLHAYRRAVAEATRDILSRLDALDLTRTLDEARLRRILIDEGVAHSAPEALIQNYLGRSGERCLLTYGLTHSYEHVGEIGVIVGLLGIEMD
jgi:hypothetical protein